MLVFCCSVSSNRFSSDCRWDLVFVSPQLVNLIQLLPCVDTLTKLISLDAS